MRSDVELRPRATHGALGPIGQAAGGTFEGRRRPAAPAARSRPADPVGLAAGGASRSMRLAGLGAVRVMRSRHGVVDQSGHPVWPMDVPN